MSNPILRPINLFFLRKLKGIIVLGNSQLSIYDDAALQPKLSVIPNFFEDALKLPTEAIQQKFLSPPPIKLLYLSNLIRDKGYYDLFEAFKNLTAVEQTQFELHFAGKLDPLNPQFVEEIRPFTNVHYHGIVQGEQKKNLLATCHIFCLPTYYYAEGQPISILEAYAAGCVVITTNHSGIRDIFSDKINGYEVSKQSPESIVNCLRSLLKNQNELVQIGVSNALHAQKNYTEKTFITNVFDVLLDTKI